VFSNDTSSWLSWFSHYSLLASTVLLSFVNPGKLSLYTPPQVSYILLCRAQIPNCNSDGKYTMQLGVRKEEASGGIDIVHDTLVQSS